MVLYTADTGRLYPTIAGSSKWKLMMDSISALEEPISQRFIKRRVLDRRRYKRELNVYIYIYLHNNSSTHTHVYIYILVMKMKINAKSLIVGIDGLTMWK